MTDSTEIDRAKALIATGSDLAGAAVGGAVGFLAAGPVGAAAAGSLSVALSRSATKLLGDFAERTMSAREQARVGAVAALTLDKLNQSNNAGTPPRDDGFFDSAEGQRSSAEELLEGTLRKAREEHEERKLSYLGNFYHNLSVSPGVSAEEANYYIRLFGDLTFRQVCMAAILYMRAHQPTLLPVRDSDYRKDNSNMDAATVSLLQETYDLNNIGLTVRRSDDGAGYTALLGWHDVNPARMELTGLGERFAKLFFGSGNFEMGELENVAQALR